MMDVPFVDLKTQHARLLPEISQRLQAILSAAQFVGGSEVSGFEEEFAAFCSARACAGVASGTEALTLALLALGLSSGDEVITVPNTFIATTEAISRAGGTFRFVDCHPETFTLDPGQIERALTDRVVGIVPIHLYGHPADMDPIVDVSQRHGLWVLEDAAQAHGAAYKGRRCGSIGMMGCFSFYPGKNLGACGEAGAVVSDDTELVDKVRVLRDHGQAEKHVHLAEGYNGRLDAMQAAILRIKLRHLEEWNERRRWAAAAYRDRLGSVPEISLPVEAPYARAVYHLYVIRTDERDRLRDRLSAKGIGSGLHYPIPLHLQPAYGDRGFHRGEFPEVERLAAQGLSLPMHPELTEPQIDYVAEAIGAFFGHRLS